MPKKESEPDPLPAKASKKVNPKSLENLTYRDGRPETYPGQSKDRRALYVTEQGWGGVAAIARRLIRLPATQKQEGAKYDGRFVGELLEKLGRGEYTIVETSVVEGLTRSLPKQDKGDCASLEG